MTGFETGCGTIAARGTLCGVVVTYFPPADLADRLKKIASHVDCLVVVDNSANAEIEASLRSIAAPLGAELAVNPRNMGIAAALNQGVSFARGKGASWVLFFDQDSEPSAVFRREIEGVWQSYRGAKKLGIVGCNYTLSGKPHPQFPTSSHHNGYVAADHVITSGSAYSMPMLAALGPFREEYFIDAVDVEYCWRAERNGYAVVRTIEPLLDHSLGAPTAHRLLGLSVGTSNYPAFRRYFIARNFVLMAKAYAGSFPGRIAWHAWVHIKSAMLMVLLEKNGWQKAKYFGRGVRDGILNRVHDQPWLLANDAR